MQSVFFFGIFGWDSLAFEEGAWKKWVQERMRGRHARGCSVSTRVSLSRAPFFLAPVTSKRLLRRLGSHRNCEFVVQKKQAIYNRIQLRMERSTCPESCGRGVSLKDPIFHSLYVHRPSIFSSKSVERAWWKINRGGFIDRQRKGVGVGKKEIDVIYFSRSLFEICFPKERKERKAGAPNNGFHPNSFKTVFRLEYF